MADSNRLINQFRMKIVAVLSFRRLLTYLTIGGIIWGLAILVLRVAIDMDRTILLLPLVAIFPAAAIALIKGLRDAPSNRQIKALFDYQNNCGGLLVASSEVDLGNWKKRITELSSPHIHWKSSRSWTTLVAVVVFVATSLLAPLYNISAGGLDRLNVDRDIERITQKIETLEELEILEQSEAIELQQRLERIQTEASSNDPVKTWEALDHLENLATKTAEKAGESGLSSIEQMANAESLAAALDSSREKFDNERLSETMSELAKTINREMLENEELLDSLSQELLNALNNGQFSPEQIKELLKALKKCKFSKKAVLKKLCDAKLIDIEMLRLCEKLGQCCDPTELASLLCESCNGLCVCDALAICKGGISRGRGDAEMTWTYGSDPNGAKFKEISLPPGPISSLDQSQITGISISEPDSNNIEGKSSSGALGEAAAGGGSANTYTILPKHRQTVQRYFQRDKNKSNLFRLLCV